MCPHAVMHAYARLCMPMCSNTHFSAERSPTCSHACLRTVTHSHVLPCAVMHALAQKGYPCTVMCTHTKPRAPTCSHACFSAERSPTHSHACLCAVTCACMPMHSHACLCTVMCNLVQKGHPHAVMFAHAQSCSHMQPHMQS